MRFFVALVAVAAMFYGTTQAYQRNLPQALGCAVIFVGAVYVSWQLSQAPGRR